MHVDGLYTYPVKGCRRLEHREVEVEPWGLAGDRRWLIVDATGMSFTQREDPRLATVEPAPDGDGGLVLRAPGAAELAVPRPAEGAETVGVRVFRDPVIPATPAGPEADAWLSALFGRPLRLVWQDEPRRRAVPGEDAGPDAVVNFADEYPLLLTTDGSLDALNGWLDEPVPMTRFRPNLVVTGAPPWAEDGWAGRRLRVGELTVRVAGGCGRCVVTTVDQETGVRGREPLRALGQRRRFPGGLMFGVHLSPEATGTVRVGDPVELLDA